MSYLLHKNAKIQTNDLKVLKEKIKHQEAICADLQSAVMRSIQINVETSGIDSHYATSLSLLQNYRNTLKKMEEKQYSRNSSHKEKKSNEQAAALNNFPDKKNSNCALQ